jgi:hypothetical protein
MAESVWNVHALRAGGRLRPDRAPASVIALLVVAVLAVLLLCAAAATAAGTSAVPSSAVAPRGVEAPSVLAPWLAAAPGVAAARGASSTQTLLSDDFESGLSKWELFGNPGWSGTTYRAAAGTSSAYCAGSQISPPGPYANNMSAWMIAGPFDLSKATAATLSAKLYYVTESGKDLVNLYVSLNDENYYGTGWSGNSPAWSDKTLDLTNVYTLGNVCGKSQVWIAVMFKSDPAVVYEGAYVDNVTLTATVPGTGQKEAGLVLTSNAETVPYNGSTDLVGALLDATSGFLVPDKEVGLFWSQENKIDGEWNYAGSASSTTGNYEVRATGITRTTYFAMFFDGDSEYLSTMSNLVKVVARAKITPPAVPKAVQAGKLVTAWGTILPKHTTAQNRTSHTKIYLERYYGGKWHAVVSVYAQKYRNTKTATEYAVSLRYHAGSWRVKAVHQDDDHAKSTSSWRTFTAR